VSVAEQTESPLDRPVTVTLFPDFAARARRQETVTFRQLALRIRNTTGPEKKTLPWLKLAGFGDIRTGEGCLRHNPNVLAISGIEGDYDDEKISMDDAVAMLRNANVADMIYASPSHTDGAPRWRVLCPLSWDWSPDARAGLVARLNGVLGGVLASESFTLSQSFYFGSVNDNPRHRVELIDGAYIDQRDDLDASAIGKPTKAPPPDRPVSSGVNEHVSDKRWDGYLRTLLDSLRRQAVDGKKYAQLWAHAVWLGGCHEAMGLSNKQALSMLLDCLPDSVEDWDQARRTAGEGLNAGRQKPITLEDRPYKGHANGHHVNGHAFRPAQPEPADGAGKCADEPTGRGVPPQAEEPQPDAKDADGTKPQDPVDAAVAELNQRFFVLNENGKVVIYSPGFDAILRRHRYDRLTFEDFKRLYLNRKVKVGVSPSGSPIYRIIAISGFAIPIGGNSSTASRSTPAVGRNRAY
jgi:hypothetical protein